MSAAARALLRELYAAALRGVDPAVALARVLKRRGDALELSGDPIPPREPWVVIAAGKAAAGMAAALEELAGDHIRAGVAVTKDGHEKPLRRIELLCAGHPLPDARSPVAAEAVLACARGLEPADRLLVLLSGGASALLAAPLPGLRLADLVLSTELLLAHGAAIDEINTVRKHLSALAGGRLARAVGSRRIELLLLSDVPGDDPAVIASGPCSPDPSSFADALAVLDARGLRAQVPTRVRAHLEAGAAGRQTETPKPGDPALAGVRAHVLASNRDALRAAQVAAEARGLRTQVVSSRLAGEARRAGQLLAGLARAAVGPVVLLAGGETTVTLRGQGQGGRNQELALAAACALESDPRITLLAAGTDGGDGPTPAAGAFADAGSVARGRAQGVHAAAALAENDSYGFFQREGGLFVTGPSGTNVMDLALVHVAAAPGDRELPTG